MKTKQVKEGYRSEKIRVGDTSIAKYSKLSKAARRVGLKNRDEVYAIYYKNPMTQLEKPNKAVRLSTKHFQP